MKVPRFRIAWIMVFVALAALNFSALRSALDDPSPTIELLALGATPMATVLMIGLLIGYWRHVCRPFIMGFELFGALALALYIVLASCTGDKTIAPYVSLFLEPLGNVVGTDRSVIFIPIAYSVAVVVLGLPQLAFALIGGVLCGKYRITITKRPFQLSVDR